VTPSHARANAARAGGADAAGSAADADALAGPDAAVSRTTAALTAATTLPRKARMRGEAARGLGTIARMQAVYPF
jgi:hypothetical protein